MLQPLKPVFPTLLLACMAGCASTNVATIDAVGELSEDEAEIWAESKQAAKGIVERLGSDDARVQAYVAAVLDRLVESNLDVAADRRPTVTVLDTPAANAAAMPHGDLFITHGMLVQLESEAELAFVMAHELVHYRRRHSLVAERYASNERARSMLLSVALTALAGTPIYGRSEPAWQRALNSRYSRELETEADTASIDLMRLAGYDAYEALSALSRLRLGEAQPRNSLFATHPDVETRMASVRALLPETRDDSLDGGVARYREVIGPLVVPQALALIENGELATAEVVLQRHLAEHPDDSGALFAVGESIRAASSSREASARAAEYYARAVAVGDAPVSAYRELGLHYRLVGDPERAREYFIAYLERAPEAVDAPLIRSYLEASQ